MQHKGVLAKRGIEVDFKRILINLQIPDALKAGEIGAAMPTESVLQQAITGGTVLAAAVISSSSIADV